MSGALSAVDAFWQQPVTRQLQQQLIGFAAQQQFVVACSGGRDSLSLARSLQLLCPNRVRVLHVNHQLQPQAASWASWLQEQCQAWQLPCRVITVTVASGNIEQQARKARYQALYRHLDAHEVLVLGHHQQDQAETVFSRMLSGSGVVGLSAMQVIEQRTLPDVDGTEKNVLLWRPLLACTRQHITELAALICPIYLDDPANLQPQFDRVFLRQTVWPLLEARWPAMQQGLSRTASLMQDCAAILHDVVAQDWQHCVHDAQLDHDAPLDIVRLMQLSPARQRLLLSRWMQGSQMYAPPLHLVNAVRDIVQVRQDGNPKIVWSGWQFRRYQRSLYRLPQSLERARNLRVFWPQDSLLSLPSGQWRWQQQAEGLPAELLNQYWHLTARTGGEVVHLRGRLGRWPLKKSLQAAQIAPWQRDQIHILHPGGINPSHDQPSSQAPLALQGGHSSQPAYGIFTVQGFWPTHEAPWVPGGWQPVRVSQGVNPQAIPSRT